MVYALSLDCKNETLVTCYKTFPNAGYPNINKHKDHEEDYLAGNFQIFAL